MTTVRLSPLERIFGKAVEADGGCLEFMGSRDRGGYGSVKVGDRMVTAHRVVAAVYLGLDIADRLTYVCHSCDNPPCVNPDHLFLGTPSENVRDSIAKGRRAAKPLPGPQAYCTKGHDLSVTRIVRPDGGTRCVTCDSQRRGAGDRRLWREQAALQCQRGHMFDAANTYITPAGRRSCVECRRLNERARARCLTVDEYLNQDAPAFKCGCGHSFETLSGLRVHQGKRLHLDLVPS